MRAINRITLATLLVCALAAPAMAGGGSPAGKLAAGGRTIAGPGNVALALNATKAVYTDGGANNDVCVTVVNGKGSTVRLTLAAGGQVTLDIGSGDSGSLCHTAVTMASLTCLGPVNCSAEWRVDNQ